MPLRLISVEHTPVTGGDSAAKRPLHFKETEVTLFNALINKFNNRDRQTVLFLVLGTVIGVAVSMAGFVEGRVDDLPVDAAARVNGKTISRAKYQVLVDRFGKDRKRVLTDEDRAHVLERLIEEELLVQRGIELGLLESDTVVRNSLVRAMIQSIVGETAAEPVSTQRLKSFYRENIDFFTIPVRLRLKQIIFRKSQSADENRSSGSEEAHNKATRAYQALENGMGFDAALKRYGDLAKFDLPDGLLPPSKVREYIGPSLTQQALKMKKGEIGRPLKTVSGYRILYLADRIDHQQQTFETVKRQVEAEYRKRRDDQALRNYLDRRKNWADIKRNIDQDSAK
ncbi:MAG: peptidyl-prolyl cis-trans isomerase [Proteobacteria bacterium]|nr:peptidyl-prolyl cis-trans isomerase [Pseudomonadota bacterium]